MKKNNLISVILITILVTSFSSAYARMTYYKRTYNVELYFNHTYNGQTVKSVMSHVGVKIGRNWFHVQDITLENSGNGFIAKKVIVDNSTNHDPTQYLLVTHEVTFDSGEKEWTPVTGIPSVSHGKYYEGCDGDYSDCYSENAKEKIALLNDSFNTVVPTETITNYYTIYH